MAPEDRAAFASSIPIGRMCTPEDVANAVCYLASPEADFITGVNLQVCMKSWRNPGSMMSKLTFFRLTADGAFSSPKQGLSHSE